MTKNELEYLKPEFRLQFLVQKYGSKKLDMVNVFYDPLVPISVDQTIQIILKNNLVKTELPNVISNLFDKYAYEEIKTIVNGVTNEAELRKNLLVIFNKLDKSEFEIFVKLMFPNKIQLNLGDWDYMVSECQCDRLLEFTDMIIVLDRGKLISNSNDFWMRRAQRWPEYVFRILLNRFQHKRISRDKFLKCVKELREYNDYVVAYRPLIDEVLRLSKNTLDYKYNWIKFYLEIQENVSDGEKFQLYIIEIELKIKNWIERIKNVAKKLG